MPKTLAELAQKLRPWLASPRLLVRTLALVALLSIPTLFHGFMADDHALRGFLLRTPPWGQWVKSPLELFSFYDGDPARAGSLVDAGFAPWWTDPAVRIAFFRPLTCFTHWVDFTLWPRLPLLMHVQTVAWYLALVAASSALFRRVLGAGWPAGLAILLYALDPTHGVLIEWIANRNALVAATFAVLSLVLHDRARREGRSRFAFASAACLALGLLGGEVALGAAGYLAAYALFLDGSRPRARIASLAPHLAVLLAWVVFYRVAGFGAHGSGIYVDPGQSPLRFLGAALRNVPLLLQTELGGIPPDILFFVPHPSPLIYVGAALIVGALLLAVAPLRDDARARYLLAGAVLSTLPGAATFPAGRLMLLPGLGLVGLVALVAEGLVERTRTWRPGLSRWSALYVGVWAGGVRLLVSPLLLVATSHQMIVLEQIIARYGDALSDDPALAGQRVVIVNAPDTFFTYYLVAQRLTAGRPAPGKLLLLAPGVRAMDLERRDASTLLVRSEEGFYRGGSELLTRSPSTPMPVGTRVAYTGLTVEVTRTDAGGVPTEALFRFAKPLEDGSLRWVAWRGTTFVPFALPAVGEARRIEGADALAVVIDAATVEQALARIFIAAEGTSLRREDRKKAVEVAALLSALGRPGEGRLLVDAAAGKACAGLLAAELCGWSRLVVIDRDPSRIAACRAASALLRPGVRVDLRAGDVADPALWPAEPDAVVALHACGPASDATIDACVGARARWLYLVPCCYGAAVPFAATAEARAEALGVPRQAEVRRAFVTALIDAERTLRLEAAGYEVTVVPFVPRSVTPHNLLWRARRAGEPTRMAQARARLERIRTPGE